MLESHLMEETYNRWAIYMFEIVKKCKISLPAQDQV